MKQYELKKVTLKNGETLAYRETGAGENVLLIHGNMSSSVHWQTAMEQLEGKYHVVAPDMRGFGDSTYHNRFDSLKELAEDIVQFVDAVGLATFYAVGWSTGGGVVLELAAELPGRVKKAVLLDTVPVTGYPMFKKDASGQPILTELLKTKDEIEADPVQVAPVLQAYAAKDSATMRAIWNAVIYNLHQPEEADYSQYIEAILQQRNLVDIDYSLLHFNMTDVSTGSAPGSGRLNLVKCPIVLLHGEKDMVVPFTWIKEMHEKYAGRMELIPFENAGHSVLTDDLDLFCTTLKQVLQG